MSNIVKSLCSLFLKAILVGALMRFYHNIMLLLEMANKPVTVGIAQTRPRFDGESPH